MKRINSVVSAVTGIDEGSFESLSQGAQVRVAYACAKNCDSMWWELRLDEANEVANAEFAARCKAEIASRKRALNSLCVFMDEMAKISEAKDTPVNFDLSHFEVDSGDFSTLLDDEVVEESVSFHSKPYAWAKRKLQEAGTWPAVLVPASKLMLFDLERVANRVAGQYIGRCIIQLSDHGVIKASKNDAQDFEIMALSRAVTTLSAAKEKRALRQRILQLAMQNPPFVGDKGYTAAELAACWKNLEEQDEDDAAADEISAEVKEVKNVVRSVRRTQLLLDAVTAGALSLRDAGVSQEVIDKFVGQHM